MYSNLYIYLYVYLFQIHDQFPLAPYTDSVTYSDLSPFNKKLLKRHCPQDYANKRYQSEKLLSTFYDRKNYVVHLENLQYYLSKGLKLKKIHRVVRFTQKAFLKEFIDKVTSLRSNARNDFELRLFKLFANSTFGKFIGECINKIILFNLYVILTFLF